MICDHTWRLGSVHSNIPQTTRSATRKICIGDVHGHYQGLMQLLNAIAPGRDDQVYFLGDLIDRGPESAQVVEFVRQSPYQSLLGNHEQLMLDAFTSGEIDHAALRTWYMSGGRETLDSYHDQELLLVHMNWMARLPVYLDLGAYWLVHAGVHPELPLELQTPHEFCWIRQEFHRTEHPFFTDKTIITGHTITFTLPGVKPGQIAQGVGWLDIDTGAYHPKSGWMTALDLTHQLVYQVQVFTSEMRVRPLAEAVTPIKREKLALRF